jgi:hypothetical protein
MAGDFECGSAIKSRLPPLPGIDRNPYLTNSRMMGVDFLSARARFCYWRSAKKGLGVG